MTIGGEKVIRGVIIPTSWDAEGRVVAAGIAADDEQEYLLERGPLTSELLGLIRQEVEVGGQVIVHASGSQRLKVYSYRLTRRGEKDEVA